MNKIFGIGISKTGTHSLTKALQVLGYKAGHWVIPKEYWMSIAYGKYKTNIMKEYDAMTDIGVATHFEQFDKAYPNSKFILTLRHEIPLFCKDSLYDWLDSCKKAWAKYEDKCKTLSGGRGFFMTSLYGSWHFNKERWDYIYRRHYREVIRYFKDRPNDLLILNIHSIVFEDAFEDICEFLEISNKKIKGILYPHKWINNGDKNE